MHNHTKIRLSSKENMYKIKLSKINEQYYLNIPEAIAKLYLFKDSHEFKLEIKESKNKHELIFLTYATELD